jgi:hypothetical protein
MLIGTWGRVSASGGMTNKYGHFVVFDSSSTYTLAFLLDGTEKGWFGSVHEVLAIDHDHNGQGDIAEIRYRTGSHVAHVRSEEAYRYYTTHILKADVCRDTWSTKISYKVGRGWSCSRANMFEQAVLYYQLWLKVDGVLEDAQRGNWSALTERLENAKTYFK